jgi:hypothetical protein
MVLSYAKKYMNMLNVVVVARWCYRYLIHKISCVFLTKPCCFWHSWKNQFLKKKVWKFKEVLIRSWSYLVLDQLQKIPCKLEDYNIQTSKFYFFSMFFSVNFFTPKLMKIRWFFFFGVFCASLPNQVEHTWLLCWMLAFGVCTSIHTLSSVHTPFPSWTHSSAQPS